ncbi:MAG TPA: folate-binding protein [Mycobacteriales bacterium]|nr:folate-binding protein [Mycobacteriales bacterium]
MTAVPADPPDEGVASHYGDPYREQRRLAAGEGAVDLSHREVLRISGPDRLSWLHSLLSQHVADLQPGRSCEALVLSPHGHVEHHLHLVETGDAVLAHVEPGTAGALRGFLDSMRFMLRVEVAAVDDLGVVWTPGAEPPGEVTATETGFGRYAFVPRAGLAAALGDAPAGVLAHEALRVAALRPRRGLDTDHRTLPHEVGWLVSAVHLDKGCYRGQESVARVHNLGRPPRRLALLHLDGSDVDLPAVGAPLLLGEREVGRVGTSVRHHELGPLALALVKRQVPDEAELSAGGVPARIDGTARIAEPESAARVAAEVRSSLTRFR